MNNESHRPFTEALPGLAVLVLLGGIAHGIGVSLAVVSPLIVAVVLGLLVSNVYPLPKWADRGIAKHNLLLETGIVLMGVRFTFDNVLHIGPRLVVLVIAFLIASILLIELVSSHVFHLSRKLGSLLASGLGICGVSAIIAVSASIEAKGSQISYAVATILLFDSLTLFAYPIIGHFFDLPDVIFGIWAGISMFSTGPATAAGFIYSDTAGQWAALTKVLRNMFIGVVAVLYSVYYHSPGEATQGRAKVIWRRFPKFVIGMLLVMVIANVVGLTEEQVANAKSLYKWLFVFAFVGLGFTIKLDDMRAAGITPILTILVGLVIVSSVSLVVVLVLFG